MLNEGLIGGGRPAQPAADAPGLQLGAAPAAAGAAVDLKTLIKDGSDAGFVADVIEASKTQPVIVDFWATWCGPCRQLTPALEKAVTAAGGKVKLVKIDVDRNPAYAGQLRVQSIPTVYGFVGGAPVDGFMGAQPESQLKAFIDRLLAAAKQAGIGGEADLQADIDAVLAMAAESVQLGDLGGAAQAYAEVLQLQPDNAKAIAGLSRIYLANGEREHAEQVLAMAPADSKDADLIAARSALKLAGEAPSETRAFEQRLAADPDDHEARFALSQAHSASGDLQRGTDELFHILERDREWNEGVARKQLLTLFEAAGFSSDVAKNGRKRLSALLFA